MSRPATLSPPAALSPVAALVRRHDPDRFLTALFAPAARREVLFTLYAFNHELARAREVVSEPMLALIRLQWWREVVQGAARRHEVATPLAAAIAQGLLLPADLLAMIDGREAEAEPAIPDRAAWHAYLAATGGAAMAAAGRALGADAAMLARLRHLGAAHALAGQLRNLPALARAGRVLLPQDVLGAHGLTVHDITAGRGAEKLRAALGELAAEGRAALAGRRTALPRAVIAAALPAVLARRDLARATPAAQPPGGRLLGDRLAVLAAWLRGRV
ncbi:MAG: squalene/phytoene synthase family protein [Acetobacteraceae bacterium]|nr:squalene/phytoene synthase family protein [Acetobacteraceae bacterium]